MQSQITIKDGNKQIKQIIKNGDCQIKEIRIIG